ncbi:4-hydroxythreonine-4-phosphate dehydrogenase PdxA [Candidatus Magnetaquicoccus inordinatus]|uniref:4-hydroxythreonine-4-phosphate dehydrogenase PdxA n=1 Tax=Candidatus Magnetaquicoccus inordinatus TaxID=2496818 RepID=UPI00102CF0E9|nr:4-hydroxythreonine-4-phosphate dehydrogenase PdxA [Candidatus Magnetaquicoccus inordinatus]
MLAVTMGDPVGVGPEVALKSFLSGEVQALHIGDPQVFRRTAEHLGFSVVFQEVSSPEEARQQKENHFLILPTEHKVVQFATAGEIPFGRPHPSQAAATMESIMTACRMAMAGRVDGVVTPPINKAVLHSAGYDVPGHTELLAHCAGVSYPVMMLAGEGLRVVPVTIHQSLRSVAESLHYELLEKTIRITYEALKRDFAINTPRLMVAALNPHAGEKGAFGHEEQEIIEPVCRALSKEWPEGSLMGPLPADTLFHPQARASYDAILCMYHDQALIPIKMLAFGNAVNITLGLPIVRTSVDHGTAYPIAGQGVANATSLQLAMQLARQLADNRLRSHSL